MIQWRLDNAAACPFHESDTVKEPDRCPK
jgi:hypothetical protein